jgi:hypothetical protein
MQQAASHWRHIIGTEMTASSYSMTETAELRGLKFFPLFHEQMSSQLRHPIHFSGLIISCFAIFPLLLFGLLRIRKKKKPDHLIMAKM